MNTPEALIYLVSCAVDEKIPEKSIVNKIDLNQVYSLASKHMLSAAVAMALEDAGFRDERSSRVIGAALRKNMIFEEEKKRVLEKLDEAEIWHMPLKGSVLKDFYPKAVMREMSDYDILFDASRAKDVKRIMKSLNFSVHEFGIQNEDVYCKKPIISFEMHRTLFGARHGNIINNYYKNIKQKLIKDTGSNFGFSFIPEDFYIYMIAHEYTHYSLSGTGLRSLLDVYVFLKNRELNWLYINTELSKLEISDFEKLNRQLTLKLFTGKNLKDNEKEMLKYILSSGVYGTMENYVSNDMAKAGRLEYFLKRLTLPYSEMIEEYPILQKAPILYPFYWLSRLLIRGLILRRKRFFYQMKALIKGKN